MTSESGARDTTPSGRTPRDKAVARALFGLCVAGALAGVIAAATAGLRTELLVLALIVGSVLLAALQPLAARVAPRLPVVEVLLFTFVLCGQIIGAGPWAVIFLALGAVAGSTGLAVRLLGSTRGIAVVALLLLLAGGVGLRSADDLSETRVPLHTWNQFHYVLGTKYFDELEYFDIYNAMLLMDDEREQLLQRVKRVRDLHSYEFVTRAEALQRARDEGLRERFTDERWAQFGSDLEVFYDRMGKGVRKGVVTDLGFNPSPAWLIAHRPLLNAVDLHDGRTLEVAALLQVPMYIVTFALMWWAFGLRNTLWIALWTTLFFGNRGRLLGGYFTYDWFVLGLIPIAFIAKARAGLAAPLLAYGGLMRGFVGLLCFGPVVGLLSRLRGDREGRSDRWAMDRQTVTFLAVLGASMAIIGLLSLTTPLGADAWSEWADKISLHAHRIQAGSNHLGLATLFGEDYAVPGIIAEMEVRRGILAGRMPALRAVQAILVLWTFWVMRRRTRIDACALGLIPAFAMMVLSRYYYATWVVFLLLGVTPKRPDGRVPVRLAMFGFLLVYQITKVVRWEGLHGRYHVANVVILVLSVAALAYYSWVDLRAWRARSGSG